MATAKLSRLIKESLQDPSIFNSTVIAVPDVGGRPASTWLENSRSWLAHLIPAVTPRPDIREFSYDYENLSAFSWANHLGTGDKLLEEISKETANPTFLRRPLVFICHGLGGYIVKAAIIRLAERYDQPVYRAILSSIKGAIFLGCPHITTDRLTAQKTMPLLLKACTGLSNRQIEHVQEESTLIAKACDRFRDLGIDLAVISAFETLPTKISGGIRGKREILVGRAIAEIGLKAERLVEVEANHYDICDLQPSNSLQEIIANLFLGLSVQAPLSQQALSQLDDAEFYGMWQGTDSEYDMSHTQAKPHSSSQGETLTSLHATAGSSDFVDFTFIPRIASQPTIEPIHSVKLPCHLFGPHPRNTEFFSREDILESISQALLPEQAKEDLQTTKSSLKTFALCGMGGVGKTQAALEFAYSHKEHFEAIFFVQAADTAKLAQGFANICGELGLAGKDEADDQAVSRDSVFEWLSQPTRSLSKSDLPTARETPTVSWLLIFDNADDLNVLSAYWPVAGTGSVLITSRDPLAMTGSYVPSTRGIDLSPFSTAEAALVLRKLTGYDRSNEDLELSIEISKQLGGLPLGISQIAGTIVRRDLGFDEFLLLCEEDSFRQECYNENINNEVKTIFTTWALEDLGPSARSLLDLLVMMDPDQIHESIITKFIFSASPEAKRFMLQDFPSKFPAYVAARTELTRCSLLRRNTEKKIITLHRLVQDAVRMKLSSTRRSEIFCAVIELLYQAWPFGINDYSTQRWKTCEPLFPHINHARTYYEGHTDDLAMDEAFSGHFAHLLMDTGWYYLERGNPLESLPFQTLAQQLLEASPSSETIRLSEVQHTQAEIHIYTGNTTKGYEHALAALSLCKASEDPGHRLPQAYNEVAEAQCNLHQYDEAIANCDQATALYLEQEGHYEHFESSAFARTNKAFCLWRQTKNEEAAAILMELLESRKAMYGPDGTVSFKSGLALLMLGKVRASQGRHAEAQILHQKSHDQFLATLGRNHYRVAGVLYRLAEHAELAGDGKSANDMLHRSVKIYGDRLYYRPEVARAWFKIADVNGRGHDTGESREALRKAQSLLSEISREKGKLLERDDLDFIIQYWAL